MQELIIRVVELVRVKRLKRILLARIDCVLLLLDRDMYDHADLWVFLT